MGIIWVIRRESLTSTTMFVGFFGASIQDTDIIRVKDQETKFVVATADGIIRVIAFWMVVTFYLMAVISHQITRRLDGEWDLKLFAEFCS